MYYHCALTVWRFVAFSRNTEKIMIDIRIFRLLNESVKHINDKYVKCVFEFKDGSMIL